MTLAMYIRATAYGTQTGSITWNSPSGPVGSDWYETYIGLAPQGNEHPPSLKNPKKTPVPTAQTGWKKGSSQREKKQARADMVEIHKRMRRQIGKPEVAHTALFPVYPNIWQKM
jgi:hypothetical protein